MAKPKTIKCTLEVEIPKKEFDEFARNILQHPARHLRNAEILVRNKKGALVMWGGEGETNDEKAVVIKRFKKGEPLGYFNEFTRVIDKDALLQIYLEGVKHWGLNWFKTEDDYDLIAQGFFFGWPEPDAPYDRKIGG